MKVIREFIVGKHDDFSRYAYSMILALFKRFLCVLDIMDGSFIFLSKRAASKYFSSLTKLSIILTNSGSDKIRCDLVLIFILSNQKLMGC